MTNLKTIQEDFTSHLLNKKNLNIIKESSYSKLETLARLNIYRNNVLSNFESILSSIFEVTKNIIGSDNFKKLAIEYSKEFPSKSGDLNNYGNFFPRFLKSHKPLYLSDLAQLELFYHQSYFAKDCDFFDIKKFQKISPEKYKNITFTLHPSCFLLSSKFPIFSIWKNKIKNGKKIININNPEFATPEFVITARAIDGCVINKLSQEEFLFLFLIKKEEKLYNIFEKICKKTKKEIDIGKLMNHFISNGIITNFKQ